MLARIAHELFWLGRNLARAEHTARMLDGVFQADVQGRSEDAAVTLGWGSLMAIMGGSAEGEPTHRDHVLRTLTLDPENPASVTSCIGRAREGARSVRDVISQEMWESINTTNLTLLGGDLSERLRDGPYSLYQYVKERSALFWGLTGRTMLRDEASAFLEAGGRIESADMMLRMMRVSLAVRSTGPAGDGHALALLQAVGGFQAYRRAVPGPPNATPVMRFLLFERSYPDSVAASVDALHAALTTADDNPRNAEPVLRLVRLSADLQFHRRAEEAQEPDIDLTALCEDVQGELDRVDSDIHARYFAGAARAA